MEALEQTAHIDLYSESYKARLPFQSSSCSATKPMHGKINYAPHFFHKLERSEDFTC
jgi:hypothetical protein